MHYVWAIVLFVVALFGLFGEIGLFRRRSRGKWVGSFIFGLALFVVCGCWGISMLHSPKPVDKKAEAAQAIATFDKIQSEYNKQMNQYKAIVTQLANGTMDSVTAYSQLKQLDSDTLMNTFSDANNINLPSDYLDAKDEVVQSVADLQNSMDELKKYLNDGKVSEMSNATDDLKSSTALMQDATMKVATEAVKNGYNPPSSDSTK